MYRLYFFFFSDIIVMKLGEPQMAREFSILSRQEGAHSSASLEEGRRDSIGDLKTYKIQLIPD